MKKVMPIEVANRRSAEDACLSIRNPQSTIRNGLPTSCHPWTATVNWQLLLGISVTLCVVLLLPLLAAAQYNRNSSRNSNRTSGRSATPAADSSYQVLSTRNMFVPDRTTPRPDREETDFRPRVRGPNVEKVLTGVAMQEGATDSNPVAFFYDPNNDETVRVTVGQPLDGKIIRSISFEGVDVVSGRSIRTIHLGDNLSGVAAASFTEPETPEAASQPTSGPSQFVSSPANSLEERMRQRRQQEK